MQKKYFITALLFTLFAGAVFGQKLHKSQVPSVILNGFHQQFPNARDVEWKLDQKIYKVEFETGIRFYDHTVWYNESGKMIRHKEEIPKRQLPKAVQQAISREFKGYFASDVKRITEGKKVIYSMEMKRLSEEWKINVDSSGKILSKVYD